MSELEPEIEALHKDQETAFLADNQEGVDIIGAKLDELVTDKVARAIALRGLTPAFDSGDAAALSEDWYKVGDDLWQAMGRRRRTK